MDQCPIGNSSQWRKFYAVQMGCSNRFGAACHGTQRGCKWELQVTCGFCQLLLLPQEYHFTTKKTGKEKDNKTDTGTEEENKTEAEIYSI